VIWENEDFKFYKCDFVVLLPFNIIIDEQQFYFLKEAIETSKEALTNSEEKKLCEALKINKNKKRMTAKNTQLKIVPLTCDFCMKYTICENYSAEKLNDKNSVVLYVMTANNKRTRQILNILNSQKKEEYLVSTTSLKEEQLEMVKKTHESKKNRMIELAKKDEKSITDSLEWNYLQKKGGVDF
jgi:hypothetical protein